LKTGLFGSGYKYLYPQMQKHPAANIKIYYVTFLGILLGADGTLKRFVAIFKRK